mmetsp:Transcript_24297/g.71358  ORF Transcript_24297/g.71358 Transcript_24297/m.71358 type:complete len:239 (-) Transcript_24297:3-719(-)
MVRVPLEATEEPVKGVEATLQGRVLLVKVSQVPFADHVGAVVRRLAEVLRQELEPQGQSPRVVPRNEAMVHARVNRVEPCEQRGPGRSAHLLPVVIGKPDAVLPQGVNVRGEERQVCGLRPHVVVTLVIDVNQEDVRGFGFGGGSCPRRSQPFGGVHVALRRHSSATELTASAREPTGSCERQDAQHHHTTNHAGPATSRCEPWPTRRCHQHCLSGLLSLSRRQPRQEPLRLRHCAPT